MDCLNGLVSYRGGAEEAIFFVNDLPSISIKEVDASLNSESASAVELIEQKINLAGELIASRIKNHFNPKFKGNSIIENSVAGFYQDDLQLVEDQTGYLVGKQFELLNYNYVELFISKIGLQASTSGAKNVVVYDLLTGKLLHTISVTTVAAEITYVDVYKLFKSYGQKLNIFIGYEYTGSYKTILSKNNCSSCTGQVYQNPYIRLSNRKITTGASKISENLVSGSEDGLSVTYSVNCSFDPFICSIKHLLAEAIWWKAGELLVTELRYSKRNNSIITVFQDDYDALISAYSNASNEILNTNFQNMRLPDNECFYCNKRIKFEVRV